MVYLDYSATTPVNSEVLDTYTKVCREYIGNPNSMHKLGVDARRLIDASTSQIADVLSLNGQDIIYTSGASEANNTAIKGVASRYSNRGHHIITTTLEHSSIIEPLKYLETKGFRVSFVKLDEYGRVDLDDLERLIDDDTILVSIGVVNSEVGVVQDLEAISQVVRRHSSVILHSDVTQAIGKIRVDFSLIDMASFSAQKFFGMKGVGALIKNKSLEIDPLIHGGKSTTIYRSGTPATPLIASMAKAIRLAYSDFDSKSSHVKEIHDYLINKLSKLDVSINSNKYSIDNIVNFSLNNIKSEVMLNALSMDEVYISTKTACSKGEASNVVYALTHDEDASERSMRVSISYLTTKDEIDIFIEKLENNINKLNLKK